MTFITAHINHTIIYDIFLLWAISSNTSIFIALLKVEFKTWLRILIFTDKASLTYIRRVLYLLPKLSHQPIHRANSYEPFLHAHFSEVDGQVAYRCWECTTDVENEFSARAIAFPMVIHCCCWLVEQQRENKCEEWSVSAKLKTLNYWYVWKCQVE